MIRSGGDVEAMIREEKRLTAIESQKSAWAEGHAWDIETEIMAEAALSTAFGELVSSCGGDEALAMLERMREKLLCGAFDPLGTRH